MIGDEAEIINHIGPTHVLRLAFTHGRNEMAKGNRETKKPKKVVAKTIVAAESMKGGGAKIMPTLAAARKK